MELLGEKSYSRWFVDDGTRSLEETLSSVQGIGVIAALHFSVTVTLSKDRVGWSLGVSRLEAGVSWLGY